MSNHPTQDWQRLLSLALLGTGQAGGEVPVILDPDTQQSEDARERQALLAAGTLSLMRKAGYVPIAATAATAWQLHPPESLPELGLAGQQALQQLIEARQPALLGPYLEQLGQRGLRLPSRLILLLIELAGKDDTLKRRIIERSGNRGRWLAGHHPDWVSLLPPQNPEDAWHHGTPAQRKAYLALLRLDDPDQARSLFAQAVAEAPSKELATLLEVMATNLSAADIPVLEPQRSSKSKEVRLAAIALLARIPEHPLAQTLFELAKPLLQIKGNFITGKRLEVDLPATYDPAWKALCIEEKSPRFPSERGGWLGQMLALIPPARWEAYLDAKPENLVALAAKSEYANILLPGWTDASRLHQDDKWLESLLDHAFTSNGRDTLYDLFPSQTLAQIPGNIMEPVMLRQMKRVTEFHGPQLLQLHFAQQPDLWSKEFTIKVIYWLAKIIQSSTKRHAQYSPVLIILGQMSLMAHPDGIDHLGLLENELAQSEAFNPREIKHFEQMRTTLLLRKALHESLI